MGFRTAKSYNEARFGNLFLLRNDGDYADVVFLYQSADDVLVADTHYVKSSQYSGYVHCCGSRCPACAKNIRVQTKLFIPLYNVESGEIQFWDRTLRFEPQLQQSVFRQYPNPSEIIFRITRHGAAGDVNTTYEIKAITRNTVKSYDAILSDNGAVMPDYYERVCKEYSSYELEKMLNDSSNSSSLGESYVPSPRASYAVPSVNVTTSVESPISSTFNIDDDADLAEPDF